MARFLDMQCQRCKVASTCPKKGSSPLALESGKKVVFCRIIGGYGITAIDNEALSEASKKIRDRDGPCLTLAEVPTRDESSGFLVFETTKIFHHPILHPRQTSNEMLDRIYPRSHKA